LYPLHFDQQRSKENEQKQHLRHRRISGDTVLIEKLDDTLKKPRNQEKTDSANQGLFKNSAISALMNGRL
jgi:predicted transcriptional regulator